MVSSSSKSRRELVYCFTLLGAFPASLLSRLEKGVIRCHSVLKTTERVEERDGVKKDAVVPAACFFFFCCTYCFTYENVPGSSAMYYTAAVANGPTSLHHCVCCGGHLVS